MPSARFLVVEEVGMEGLEVLHHLARLFHRHDRIGVAMDYVDAEREQVARQASV